MVTMGVSVVFAGVLVDEVGLTVELGEAVVADAMCKTVLRSL